MLGGGTLWKVAKGANSLMGLTIPPVDDFKPCITSYIYIYIIPAYPPGGWYVRSSRVCMINTSAFPNVKTRGFP